MASLLALTQCLSTLAGRYDATGEWPEDSIAALAEAGGWRWIISRKYGGEGWLPVELLRGYEAVGRGCLGTLLILTQRDAACDLIERSSNEAICDELMPRLAAGEILTTVGIAQITTSHRSGPSAMTATPTANGYRLDGFIPWATAAPKCHTIVTAAELPDGRQLLVVLPADLPGVRVEPPMRFMALQHAWTSRVVCEHVEVPAHCVLHGPAPKVLARRSPVKPMVVSSAGIGLAGALAAAIEDMRDRSPAELNEASAKLLRRYTTLREKLFGVTARIGDEDAEVPSEEIRIEVNDLLWRLAAVAVTYAKGHGYVKGHPVERLAREAMFFLVWSAPDSIRSGTVQRLLR